MKIFRYFMVGGTAAAVDMGIFAVLLYLTHGRWFESAALSFVIATAVNYALSIRHVFESGVRFGRTHEISLIFLVSLIGLLLNQSTMWLLIKEASLNLWISKILATMAVFLWNFSARHFFVFRARR